MSIISDSQIKRGDKITSADLNQKFTDVNSAFPLGEINFSQESVDLPQFATQNASGKAGIILKNMDRWSSSSSVTIQDDTVSIPAFLSKTVLFTQAVSYVVATNDILRIYWHLQVEPAGNSSSPTGSNSNGLCWVAWLEWDIGAGYVPVPNQVDMVQLVGSGPDYGANVEDLNACTLIQHGRMRRPTVQSYRPKFSVYGDWLYKSDSSVNIQGLRLVARGMFLPLWTSGNKNALKIVASSGDHSCDVDGIELGYIQQRSS